ncbi:DUF6170 family protein [Aliidiomarina celeris]|uniref:DUF6170 family protein n=1 Tax=Aliidiomarina celeris TaxID=2249428 RepID=UPI000DEA1FD9|nr:DUF6170 family protein [Aliidiomarina celeris]
MVHFSTKHIEELQGFSPTERVAIIQRAAKAMPFGRKAIANILKVLIIVALFWSLIEVPGVLWKVVSLLAAGILYPVLLFPVTLTLARPYIQEEITRQQRSNSYQEHEPSAETASQDSEHS